MKNIGEIKNIVLLGAGSVATHLSHALNLNDYRIVQIYSRTSDSAGVLAMKTNSEYITDIDLINKDADLYIVALKDSVVESLLSKVRVNGIVVHTSGTLPMEVLKNMSKRYGVFYPLQTFSISRPIKFDHIPMCLEASDEQTLEAIRGVAVKLSDKIYDISSELRRYIHLAAVFSCNFSNFMYVAASDILKKHDINFDILIPLMKEFFDKVTFMEPWEAQTGPAVREDHAVIDRHMLLLDEFPDFKEIYTALTKEIIKRKRNQN